MSHSYNYSSTNQPTNSLYSQIFSFYRQSGGFADRASVLHNQPLLYALRVIFMPAIKSSDSFLLVVISLKLKAKYTLQAIRDVRITKRKKTRKCSSIGKHSKALTAHNWKIIMHYKSRQHKLR
uniref:Ring finger protein n=1 Tax=Solanum tuberosum TaxID=4113 RepID=M1B8J8_SOLTU